MPAYSFLDMPAELRVRVYKDVYRHSTVTIRKGNTIKDCMKGTFNKNILLTCWTVKTEADSVLAQMVKVKIESDTIPTVLRYSLLPDTSCLRYITLVHRHANLQESKLVNCRSCANVNFRNLPSLRKVKILGDLRYCDWLAFPRTNNESEIQGYLEGSHDEETKIIVKQSLLLTAGCLRRAIEDRDRKYELHCRFKRVALSRTGEDQGSVTLIFDLSNLETVKRLSRKK